MTRNDQRHSLAHDWDGADDPDNPRNFSYFTRVFSITTVTCVAFISAFAGAIYVPAQEEIMSIFDCSYETAVLPLSLFNLGLAFGPIIGAPLPKLTEERLSPLSQRLSLFYSWLERLCHRRCET
jgi:hypothetical protein